MYLRSRYKLHDVETRPKGVLAVFKHKKRLASAEFEFEEDVNIYQEEKNDMAKQITINDASVIAQLVTEIDEKTEKGVEALYYILHIIQQGGSSSEAIAYAHKALISAQKKTKKA